jgi:hypothetical protein
MSKQNQLKLELNELLIKNNPTDEEICRIFFLEEELREYEELELYGYTESNL